MFHPVSTAVNFALLRLTIFLVGIFLVVFNRFDGLSTHFCILWRRVFLCRVNTPLLLLLVAGQLVLFANLLQFMYLHI